ncbi:hypothetical protein GJAV_G00128410 [Gymnothorax javanicus]|nr:hypothetical protein GJAV_G00128410 [Gymnothorax javanicus]
MLHHETTAFSVTTSTPIISVPENQGADLKCSYNADFGTPRLNWKFKNLQNSQSLVVFDGKPTTKYENRVELYSGGLRFNKVTRADNGEYTCEVSSVQNFGNAVIKLIVQVPPTKPKCQIPKSVTTGRAVMLACFDKDGSPPCTYKWFKNKTPLPEDPSKFPEFKNSTFKVDPKTGTLLFPQISKLDTGEYYCTASNGVGSPQSCNPVRMGVHDLNKGGNTAGVTIALLALGLLAFGLCKPRTLYQPPSDYFDEDDGEFRQKSSFVV